MIVNVVINMHFLLPIKLGARTSKHIFVFAFDPLSLTLSLISCINSYCSYHLYAWYCLCALICVEPKELQIAPQLLFRGIQRSQSRALHREFGYTFCLHLVCCNQFLISHYLSLDQPYTYSPPLQVYFQKGVPFGYLEFSHAFGENHAHTRARRRRHCQNWSPGPGLGAGTGSNPVRFFLDWATLVQMGYGFWMWMHLLPNSMCGWNYSWNHCNSLDCSHFLQRIFQERNKQCCSPSFLNAQNTEFFSTSSSNREI